MHLIRKFYANWDPRYSDSEIKIRGQVTFSVHDLNATLGTIEADSLALRQLNITHPYADIRYRFSISKSIARWFHHKESSLHLTLPYTHMNREAHMWLKII